MKLKANRVILFVKNVPASAKYYKEVLGLKIEGDSENKSWIDLDAGSLKIGLHSGGSGNKSKRDPKIVFYCKDVEKARESLKQRGAKLGVVKSFGDLRFCDGADPDGNLYQLSNRS